jgi:methylated-DNA-[protein]-cysteine S-methyltransferase
MKFKAGTVQASYDSPLGRMIVAATDRGLAGLWFEDQRHLPDTSIWPLAHQHPLLRQAMQQLTDYFAGRRMGFDIALDLDSGTAFQQSVWQALLQIPHGSSRSYGQLSSDIGRPAAARAVGAAVGRNPLSIIVPCHRVLGAHGALTGYAGGLERKVALLRLEGADFRIGSPETD